MGEEDPFRSAVLTQLNSSLRAGRGHLRSEDCVGPAWGRPLFSKGGTYVLPGSNSLTGIY